MSFRGRRLRNPQDTPSKSDLVGQIYRQSPLFASYLLGKSKVLGISPFGRNDMPDRANKKAPGRRELWAEQNWGGVLVAQLGINHPADGAKKAGNQRADNPIYQQRPGDAPGQGDDFGGKAVVD